MAALKDSGSKDHGAKQAEGGKPNRKRARSLGVVAGGEGAASASAGARKEKNGSSAPAAGLASAPASASRARPESAAASLADVTVEDADALDCGVCFLPLKPPIFQCEVGHVVCSPCCDKLKATGKCHVCGVTMSRYRRCHAMERLVESIRVPCPHASHGCTVRPAYHDLEGHCLACPHAPCHCPGEACSFVGSTAALLDHCGVAHGWPCTTKVKADSYNGSFTVRLNDGFNFLLADCPTGNQKQGATASVQCLLLLTVARQPLDRTISVLCIDPHSAAIGGGQGLNSKEMECDLRYSLCRYRLCGGNPLIRHYQRSTFRLACTNLSNGLPKPEDCFQFFVPTSLIGEQDKDGIKVEVAVHIAIK